jgi:hypothetical protein
MSTKTETQAPTCRRCHGTGHEPGFAVSYNARQMRQLGKLAELGGERAELQRRKAYMRTEGRARYDQVLATIRSTIAAAESLGIQTADVMAALELSSAAFYKIKNGQTGG